MDFLWDFLKDLGSRGSAYGIAAFLILIWWVGRSFARLYHQAAGGPNRLERPDEQERPRRRLPLT